MAEEKKALINFTKEEIGTIFSSLLRKSDMLKHQIENFNGDSILGAHLYDNLQGINKSGLDKQVEKANFLQFLTEDLKETQAVIQKISDYFDKRDGTTTDL